MVVDIDDLACSMVASVLLEIIPAVICEGDQFDRQCFRSLLPFDLHWFGWGTMKTSLGTMYGGGCGGVAAPLPHACIGILPPYGGGIEIPPCVCSLA